MEEKKKKKLRIAGGRSPRPGTITLTLLWENKGQRYSQLNNILTVFVLTPGMPWFSEKVDNLKKLKIQRTNF